VKTNSAIRPFPLSAASAKAGFASSREEIAKRAEAIWREKGCPKGCDDEIWLEAERQLGRTAAADPRSDFKRDSGDMMEELNERFPGPGGKETTSL